MYKLFRKILTVIFFIFVFSGMLGFIYLTIYETDNHIVGFSQPDPYEKKGLDTNKKRKTINEVVYDIQNHYLNVFRKIKKIEKIKNLREKKTKFSKTIFEIIENYYKNTSKKYDKEHVFDYFNKFSNTLNHEFLLKFMFSTTLCYYIKNKSIFVGKNIKRMNFVLKNIKEKIKILYGESAYRKFSKIKFNFGRCYPNTLNKNISLILELENKIYQKFMDSKKRLDNNDIKNMLNYIKNKLKSRYDPFYFNAWYNIDDNSINLPLSFFIFKNFSFIPDFIFGHEISHWTESLLPRGSVNTFKKNIIKCFRKTKKIEKIIDLIHFPYILEYRADLLGFYLTFGNSSNSVKKIRDVFININNHEDEDHPSVKKRFHFINLFEFKNINCIL